MLGAGSVTAGDLLEPLFCAKCKRFLLRARFASGVVIEMRCRHCKHINVWVWREP